MLEGQGRIEVLVGRVEEEVARVRVRVQVLIVVQRPLQGRISCKTKKNFRSETQRVVLSTMRPGYWGLVLQASSGFVQEASRVVLLRRFTNAASQICA